MKKILFMAVCLSVLTSCSKQPTCSDKLVKNHVRHEAETMIIAYDALRGFQEANRYRGYFSKIANENGISMDEVYDRIRGEIQDEISKDDGTTTKYSEYINLAKENYNLNLELSNIRTSSKDEELKKCGCEAELDVSNGKSVNVFYDVQINEDKELVVEMEMLDINYQ